MRSEVWLTESTKLLRKAGVGTAELDSLVLLEDETGKDRAYLLAHPETVLQGSTLKKLEWKLARRTKHEPLAYIRGFTEFYGRRFMVNKHVLEPRPESEAMIDLLKEIEANKDRPYSKVCPYWDDAVIVDVGTGSGALAITARLEYPATEVVATDIDSKCLVVARQNAKHHKVPIKFFQGDLLEPLMLSAKSYELWTIMANLPYIPDGHTINQAAANEPKIAIFGGPDGLDLYRRLFEQISSSKSKPKYILTESLPPQHQKLVRIASNASYSLLKSRDFIQVFENS